MSGNEWQFVAVAFCLYGFVRYPAEFSSKDHSKGKRDD